MKFILEEQSKQSPIHIFLEKDNDGDVVIKASNGRIKADIAVLVASGPKEGQLYSASYNREELKILGFKVDNFGKILDY
jgi:hypothetical protein